MLLQRFHLALASAAAAVVVLGFMAGASVWHIDVTARAVASDAPITLLSSEAIWLVGGVTTAVLIALVGVSIHLTRTFRQSMATLWDAIDAVQAGPLSDEEVPAVRSHDDELTRAARTLRQSTQALKGQTVSRAYVISILDAMAEMLFVADADGRVLYANASAATRLATTPDALKGLRLADLFDGDPLSAAPGSTVERSLKTPQGEDVSVLVSRSSLQRPDATDPDVVCVAQDVSALQKTDAALEQSQRGTDGLRREMRH